MARYTIDYCSAPTGYGWREKTDSITEVKKIVRSESYGRCITASVSVWDSKVKDFIFDKDAMCYKPRIDKIS